MTHRLRRAALLACVAALAAGGCRSHAAKPIPDAPAPVVASPASGDDDDGDLVPNQRDRCPGSHPRQAIGPDGCPVPHPTRDWVDFDSGSDTLDVAARSVLDEFVRQLTAGDWRGIHFEIVGYADACGGAADNRALSLRRARSVQRYLVGHGVDPAWIVAVRGLGSHEPIERDPPGGCRSSANRRVQLVPPR